VRKSYHVQDHQYLCKFKKKEARGEKLGHREEATLAVKRMHFGNRRIKMGAKAMHLLSRELINKKLTKDLATMGLLDAVERLYKDKGAKSWNTARN